MSAADAAFDKVYNACSTSQTLSHSQLLTQMLKVLVDSRICVNKRNYGISKGFLMIYIAQRAMISNSALGSVSTQPDPDTQANASLTQLSSEEAEVPFVYEPITEDTADAVILDIEDRQVTMPHYCSRGPKCPQTCIRQYLTLAELPQRRSIATCKQAGRQCVRLMYSEGSYPSKCPVTGKEWASGSVPHQALQLRQTRQQLQQQQEEQASPHPLQHVPKPFVTMV